MHEEIVVEWNEGDANKVELWLKKAMVDGMDEVLNGPGRRAPCAGRGRDAGRQDLRRVAHADGSVALKRPRMSSKPRSGISRRPEDLTDDSSNRLVRTPRLGGPNLEYRTAPMNSCYSPPVSSLVFSKVTQSFWTGL